MRKCIGNIIGAIILLFSTVFLVSLPSMVFAVSQTRKEIYNTLNEFNLQGKLKDKDQKVSGPCWAFASTAAVEAFLAKRNMLDSSLSEKHLLNWVNKKSNESGYHTPINEGASLFCAMSYFLSDEGIYKENDCQYNSENTYYKKLNVNPSYSVRGIKYLDNNVDNIKKAVSEYGAACVGYNTELGPGHAVCIVGWNDSRQSWLVKDSNYKGFSYRWLSFSTPLLESFAITDVKKYDANEKNYQCDEVFEYGNFIIGKNITCANVFSFNAGEVLKSVIISSDAVGAICDVYVAPVDSSGRPSSNKSTWKCVKKSAVVPHKGCFEIKTNNEKLPSKAAIVVSLRDRNSKQDVSFGYTKRKSDTGRLEIFGRNNNSYKLNGNGFLNQQEDDFSSRNNVCSYNIKAIVKKN